MRPLAVLCEGLSSRCSGADRMRMRPGGLAVAKGDCWGSRYSALCMQTLLLTVHPCGHD